ncbi:hypothetical protein [Flexivirga caeni]|uniref:Uncharacterized protein n=1 Tax=Flexivirga caeni TaxID=2294115 RepID=A0A3M9M5L7_9MICO|nr:hypothetical protein [Flexivirga caeni]RNI20840.1 hypothetical protein EFY87_13075 [Flexivirga caeni]
MNISAAPAPCTQDDIAANRWSTRVAVTNPRDAGPLDYVAFALNLNDNSQDINEHPHTEPLRLAAGATGTLVLSGPSTYFPDYIIVGGGISPDGQSAKTVGEVDVPDLAAFLEIATVCGTKTPTPDPIDPTNASTAYSGGATSSPATPQPTVDEPPTPTPATTRMPVTG